MSLSLFLLDFLAFLAIISGVLVITSKNPVISVLFLIGLFINSACYLLVLGVGFVGLSYLIVYVGAITVLFLFVIMMINVRLVDLLEVGSEYTQNLPLGLILTCLFFYAMLTISPVYLNYDTLMVLPLNMFNYVNTLFFSDMYSQSFDLFGMDLGVFNIQNFIFGADTNFVNYLQIEVLAQNLYNNGAILLLEMGLILLLAMIGPIVLSIKNTDVIAIPQERTF